MDRVDFTIAIPTFNGEMRLPILLESLASQVCKKNFDWEIIIVDNNSNDNTKQVVFDFQEKWAIPGQIKYHFEPRQGAAFARLKAIQESRSNWIGFLDDDTVPDVNWLESAYEFSQKYPSVGAYSSQINGRFEGDIPRNFDRIKVFLAIINRGLYPCQYTRSSKVLPPSAGLVVRKEAWLQCVPKIPFLSGRTTQSVLTGEDTEALAYLQMAGWEIWYNPNMKLYHHIPSSRLERNYLLPMVRGIGLARHHIRMIRSPMLMRPLVIPIYFLGDLWNLLRHIMVYLGKRQDLVTDCERAFLIGTLCSPFYMFFLYLKRVV